MLSGPPFSFAVSTRVRQADASPFSSVRSPIMLSAISSVESMFESPSVQRSIHALSIPSVQMVKKSHSISGDVPTALVIMFLFVLRRASSSLILPISTRN